MSPRRGVLGFAAVLVLGLAGILAAAASDQRTRAVALGVPDVIQVAKLAPGASACESPLDSPVAFAGIGFWALTAGTPEAVRVTVTPAGVQGARQGARAPASGAATAEPSGGPFRASLGRTFAAHRPVRICVRDDGTGPIGLLGGDQIKRGVRLTATSGSVTPQGGLSLQLLRPRSRSLLSLIPAVFRRAALWRPGWVGAWTFWALCVLLLVALGAAGWGLAAALSAPEPRSTPLSPGAPGASEPPASTHEAPAR